MAHYKELREPLSDNIASDAAPQSTGQMIQDLISLVRYDCFAAFFFLLRGNSAGTASRQLFFFESKGDDILFMRVFMFLVVHTLLTVFVFLFPSIPFAFLQLLSVTLSIWLF